MAEYIERDAAMLTPILPKEYRQYQTENLDDAYEQGWLDAIDNLKNAPAADVVEATRCKDCRHHSAAAGVCNLYLHFSVGVSANDYCSFGERRTV